MRIGILTYHRARNYGAFVQAYALQQQLTRVFPEIDFEIIDFEYLNSFVRKKTDCLKLFLKLRFEKIADLLAIDMAFAKEYKKLPLSKRMISGNTKKVLEIIEKKYDYVIIGSDAVFNWQLDPIPNVYFFNDSRCNHITYAASAHLNKYRTATDEQSKYVCESLEKMKYIGVRDEETARFVKHFNPNCETFHNCDPTVVLDMNYSVPSLKKKMEKAGISQDDKIIILMLKKDVYGKYIREAFGDKYKIVSVRKRNPFADVFLRDLTPLEWSKVFECAKLTVTDFFHGSLLSLKNGTPVVSIDTSGYTDYESKAKDLFFTRLNLPEMFFDMNGEENTREHFIEKCKNLLESDCCDSIAGALEKESESFVDFCRAFGTLLENRNEK